MDYMNTANKPLDCEGISCNSLIGKHDFVVHEDGNTEDTKVFPDDIIKCNCSLCKNPLFSLFNIR